MYRFFLLIALFACFAHAQVLQRTKRQSTFLIATDSDKVLKAPMRTQFRCVRTGYFADIDNNCQMYHVCVVQEKATGHKVIRQYSFVCGNGTMFNQLTMNCDDPNESLPCEDAPRFYRLNNKIGQRDEWLHKGDDWENEDDSGYDINDYVGSESSRRAESTSAEDDYGSSARPVVGRTSYGSSTHRNNHRYNYRHRSSAGHVYAENSRFRPAASPNVRYYSGNRRVSYNPALRNVVSSTADDYNRYSYDAESSDTSETSIAAPSSRYGTSSVYGGSSGYDSSSSSSSSGYTPDLSADAPGVYYYRRREVPYDVAK